MGSGYDGVEDDEKVSDDRCAGSFVIFVLIHFAATRGMIRSESIEEKRHGVGGAERDGLQAHGADGGAESARDQGDAGAGEPAIGARECEDLMDCFEREGLHLSRRAVKGEG